MENNNENLKISNSENSSFFEQKVSSSNGNEDKPFLAFSNGSEWIKTTLREISQYTSTKRTVSKEFFVSTENMKQNSEGIVKYNETSKISGILFDCGDILVANIRPYLKKSWFAEFNGACSTDVLCIHPFNINKKF